MFPLPADTLWAMTFAAGAGAVASVFCLVRPWWARVLTFLLLAGLAIVLPWQLLVSDPPGDHEGLGALLATAVALPTLAAGAVWGLAAGWIIPRIASGLSAARYGTAAAIVVCLIPSIGVMGALLEDQRVPNAPCATVADLTLGDLSLTVPRAIGARSWSGRDDPAPDWTGHYRSTTRFKSDVADLCRRSDGGRQPLRVQNLAFAVADFRTSLPTLCAGVPSDAPPAACAAIEGDRIQNITLHAARERPADHIVGWLEGPAPPGIRTGGTPSAGHACQGVAGARTVDTCWLWRPVSTGSHERAGTLAVVRTRSNLAAAPEEALAEAEAALVFALLALKASEP